MKHQELVNTTSLNWTTHLHPYSGQKQVVRARRASEPLFGVEWRGGRAEIISVQLCCPAEILSSFEDAHSLSFQPVRALSPECGREPGP